MGPKMHHWTQGYGAGCEGKVAMAAYDGSIGVFDSGVGGISILKGLVRELPHERFVYFGDSANAPYGDKTKEEVQELSRRIVAAMVNNVCKAVVIACNTATSAAAPLLRVTWPQVPIVGVEPALKPATEAPAHNRILVLATRVTLHLDKFQRLARTYGSQSHVISVACSGLADLVETGETDGEAVHTYLEEAIGAYRGKVDSVVLGCTHYPFVKKAILDVVGPVPVFDSAQGTARQLHRRLEANGLLAPSDQSGSVIFRSSKNTPEELALYERLYKARL